MAKEDKLVAFAKPHLDPDEEVVASALGAYETKRMGTDTVRNGILLATQRRVVFYVKKVGGHEIESFPYKNISSFEAGKNLMGGNVTFYASNNRVHVKWINPAQAAQDFVEVVRQRMHEPSATTPSQPEQNEVVVKIQQLAGLRDAGILTEEEFAAKKAELLAQF